MQDAIWITWEDHRRSRELAQAVGARLCVLLSDRPYLLRAALLSWRTVRALRRYKPRLVFVQNPSIVLAAVAALLKSRFGFALIVDRHSNFKLETARSRSPVYRLFHLLSRYSVRRADLTIVTNTWLRELVDRWGGTGFVLQDKLPTLTVTGKQELAADLNVVFICTFSDDEPVAEVLEAAEMLRGEPLTIHITGNDRKLSQGLLNRAPPNVRFTGFLPEEDYVSLLASADAAMVLTTKPHTLLCGAYEAVSLGKPVVISAQEALTRYFHKGTVVTDNSAEGVASALRLLKDRLDSLSREVADLASDLDRNWRRRFDRLSDRMEALRTERGGAPTSP